MGPDYHWQYKEEFEFEIQGKKLSTEIITISLIDKDRKEIAKASINVIDSVRGPVHHDFGLSRNHKKTDIRINFDLKLAQSLTLVVRTLNIKCFLAENLKEKEYNYSLKMIGYMKDYNSEHSTNVKNPVFKASAVQENKEEVPENYVAKDFEEGKGIKAKNYFSNNMLGKARDKRETINILPSPGLNNTAKTAVEDKGTIKQIKLTHETTKKVPEEEHLVISTHKESLKDQSVFTIFKHDGKEFKRELVWEYQTNDKDIPSMEMLISGNDFSTNSIQFFLWSVKQSAGQARTDTIFIDHKLAGECYISLSKIYSELGDMETEQKDISQKLKKNIKISEKLWNHGVYIGMVEGQLLFEYTPFYRQMICGVNTETGVQKTATVVLHKERKSMFKSKGALNKEVKLLSQLKDTLIENVFKLSDIKNQNKNLEKQIEDIDSTLVKIFELLKSSHKESMTSFIYKSSEDLLACQKILLDLAKHFVEQCDQVPLTLRPIYYECLTVLILRGELELDFMGFDQETHNELMQNASKTSFRQQGASNLDGKIVKEKMKVATSYQTFMYQILDKVLKSLDQKGLIEKERAFVEVFCAVAYFRIPEFREKLLSCFDSSSNEGVEITEWRGTDWLLDVPRDDNIKNKQIIALFDWNQYFYEYLKGTAKGDQNFEMLKNVLNDSKWQKRFSKRGIAYCFFLNEWAKHVNKTIVVKDHVPWQDLPGYNILIKNFLIEMKKRDLKRLPEALVDASVALLRNERLLSIFISILYNKTNIYESSDVFAVYEVINTWLKAFQTYQKIIPSTFDYNFFLKGLFIVIDGDHALNIAKALWVVYNHFNMLPGDRKQQFCDFIFSERFFKLFLHWSYNVRQVFHHFLIYRLYHQNRSSNSTISNTEDIRLELQLYNGKRSTHTKLQRNLLISEYINAEYARWMTILENAKNKMLETVNKELFQLKMNQRGNKYSRLRVQSSANLLKNVTSSLRQSSFSGISVRNTNLDTKTESGESLIVVNSDKLDSLAVNNRKSNIKVDDGFNPFLYEPGRKAGGLKEELGSMPHDLKNENLRGCKLEKKKQDFEILNKKSPHQEVDASPKLQKQKVVHRKFVYYDQNAQKYTEIPKELLVYLLRAFNEFEETKKAYLRWAQELQLNIANKTEEDKKKIMANPPVPELVVKVPLDEGESTAIQPEDW